MERLSGIENMLARMRAAAQAAADTRRPDSAPGAADSGGFAAELERSLQRVSTMQNHANQQAQAFELGAPGVPISNVMIDLQKANIAFQATVQVRNRLVAAYQEIASMPV
jgi:flagellar hook-basal body complex protein FliE